jgi:hypothetical protein
VHETLANNKTLALKLAELENKLTGRFNVHERAIVHVLGEVRKLMAVAEQSPDPAKRKIGFKVEEKKLSIEQLKTDHGSLVTGYGSLATNHDSADSCCILHLCAYVPYAFVPFSLITRNFIRSRISLF